MDKKHAISYSYLDQLSAAEIFQLLEKASKLHRGKHLDSVRIVFPGPIPFKYAALEVPDPYDPSNKHISGPQQTVHKTLIEGFKEMTGRGERNDFPGGESKPFLEGIAWTLLHSAGEIGEKKAVETDEFLVVTRIIDEKEAENLFKNLCFHATFTRVSGWETTGGYRYLYHVKDDRKRKSSFTSLIAGDILKKSRVLKGFTSEGLITFLPTETKPGETKLKAFTRLAQEAPQLFGSGEKPGANDILAAVFQWLENEDDAEAEPELEFLYLRGIKFFTQEYFTGRKVSRISFRYMDLKESRQGLERLGEAIKNAEPYVGYKLELRPAKHLEKSNLERLHEQKARIEYNLAYLQNIVKPRPVLMRFTQKQLPALAAEIRSFPMQVIYEGSIKYGFQASDTEPAGHHFLLIDPAEATRAEVDPLPFFQELTSPHIRFQLDPFWARHYFEEIKLENKEKGALVFVPDGSSLFPSIHNWNRGNMENFLRDTMKQWFHDRLKGEIIPLRPIYIFDGKPQPNAPIQISILDWDRFEPLHTRLGWINDNLIINRTLEKEGLISELAKDTTWIELARKIKLNMEKTKRDFSDSALAASASMAKITEEMTRALTNEIDRLLKDTYRMTQRVRKMDERLKEWDEVVVDMEDILHDLREERQNTSYQKGEAKNEFWRMEQEVEQELKYSEQRRQELEKKIQDEILNMHNTSIKLKQRLKKMKL